MLRIRMNAEYKVNRRFPIMVVIILAIMLTSSADVRIENKFQLTSNRAYFSTVQAENKLYFIGGYEHSDFVASNNIDVLDLESGSWLPPLNLSTPRGHISSIVIDKRIYMLGGVSYSCLPFVYSSENNNFTTEGMTSGPTVRRPIRMTLHDSTLTVIGAYSVDFMNTTTKKWTHNKQLSSLMSIIFDATTISHHNFVFLIGGMNMTENNQSRSVWVVDSPTSTPEEFRDKITQPVTSSMFVGSWFDEDHSSVVIQFSNQCLVYHTLTQTWFHRETNNNTVTSVSYQNSTIVFFSNGYWTIDWLSMSDTWTSVDQVDFAFTIGDQLVYFGGQQMTILTNTNTTVLAQPAEIGSIALSISMTSSIYVLVNTSSAIFTYDADNMLLTHLELSTTFTPTQILRGNDSRVFIGGYAPPSTPFLVTLAPNGVFSAKAVPFVPHILVNNIFLSLGGQWSVVDEQTVYNLMPFISPIWTQQGESIYVMQDYTANLYRAVDVYNYVESKWEDSIPFPSGSFAPGRYVQVAKLDGALTLFSRTAFFKLNITNGWNPSQLVNIGPTSLPTHPTFVPVPVIDNIAYLTESSASLIVANSTSAQRITSGLSGASQQTISTDTQIIQSIFFSLQFSNIVIYDIASKSWRGVLLESIQSMVSIVMYDDVVVALGDDMESVSYLNLNTDQWTKLPFDNPYVPASMFTLQPTLTNNKTVLVIAGGYHRTSRHYTGSVRFVTIDVNTSLPITIDPPQSSNNNGTPNPVVVVAVVVPVVVVAVAAVLLAVLLVRRKRQQRRRQQSTTVGLEQQFGEWFVPFSDIHLGPQLGQGANGQVFKGKWKNTDVALKVSMTQANQSVISELSLMINMRPHPNVVQLFGFSVHPETNSVILIIEYCNGGSLDVVLHQSGDVAISKKLSWLKSIAKGLIHLHSSNTVHRDISARNVLLHQGEPKLTDFGMSRIVDSQQQRGTTKSELGPIRWMSPESLSLKQYSTKSDVWSFGILMFEILAQQEPHVDEDPIEVGRKIRDEGLVPQLPSSLECLSDLTSIMNQCCAVDPNNRASIEQVLQKLEQISL